MSQDSTTAHVAGDDNAADTTTNVVIAADNVADSAASEAPAPSPTPTPQTAISGSQVPPMCAEAQEASDREHQMTIKHAGQIYLPAIGWSTIWSASVIMQSFAIALIPSLFAQAQFSKRYGEVLPDGNYDLTAAWKTGLTTGALIGEMLGLFISGTVSEKFGYKKTMLVALCFTTALIFIPFFAPTIEILLVGQILSGIPWGMFQSLPSSFASDVMPQVLRPYLTTYINLCWVIGQLAATVVVRVVLHRTDEWAYRIPFAAQWIWPLFIFVGVALSPESPAWLVRKGRIAEAKKSLLRLTTRGDPAFKVDDIITLISETDEKERGMSTGTSYVDCFKGVDFRRTRIACAAWLVQCLCGSVLMGYSPYVYRQCGLDGPWAFNMTMIQYAIAIVGTFIAWWFMHLSGRRSLYLYGCMALFVLLLSIGSTAFASSTNRPAQWGMAIQYLLYTFLYGCTIGPVCFSLVTEMSSMRLKTKTIVLARNSYNIGSICVNILANYQLSPKPTGWGWGAKSALFWAGTCLLCIVWIFIELPEPNGRTYCDMDVLFDHGISARKFGNTNVDELAAKGKKAVVGNETKVVDGQSEGEGSEDDGNKELSMPQASSYERAQSP